ncbi:hypothetical protein BDK51DRAFT_47669 [Blyttiomyces helicus]|uniref:Uncharacterized protein n=1 Tax=Blyttiomyces helicus TaxID=388810 RepID=A0A4P9W201_9FUNG|nr:hypothetical protein BDK51DRAFT_47669 [Blyttiomyces helicus]|eukprot:RKO85732.1 hypothetical protein BDK51DRAFT_47669 [Blyttiomyces helicus]
MSKGIIDKVSRERRIASAGAVVGIDPTHLRRALRHHCFTDGRASVAEERQVHSCEYMDAGHHVRPWTAASHVHRPSILSHVDVNGQYEYSHERDVAMRPKTTPGRTQALDDLVWTHSVLRLQTTVLDLPESIHAPNPARHVLETSESPPPRPDSPAPAITPPPCTSNNSKASIADSETDGDSAWNAPSSRPSSPALSDAEVEKSPIITIPLSASPGRLLPHPPSAASTAKRGRVSSWSLDRCIRLESPLRTIQRSRAGSIDLRRFVDPREQQQQIAKKGIGASSAGSGLEDGDVLVSIYSQAATTVAQEEERHGTALASANSIPSPATRAGTASTRRARVSLPPTQITVMPISASDDLLDENSPARGLMYVAKSDGWATDVLGDVSDAMLWEDAHQRPVERRRAPEHPRPIIEVAVASHADHETPKLMGDAHKVPLRKRRKTTKWAKRHGKRNVIPPVEIIGI